MKIREIILPLVTVCAMSSYAQQKLEVLINKVDVEKGGVVLVALFDASDSFLKKPVKTGEVKAHAIEVKLVFSELKPGEYALSVFQDVNNNRKLDSNFMGIPNEPYGFSNNAMGKFGPPSFEKAKLVIDKDMKTEISLR